MTDLDHAPVPTYRRHNCKRPHTTHLGLADCIWHKATRLTGNDDDAYAVATYCDVIRVTLAPIHEAAQAAKSVFDKTGCGPGCHGSRTASHQIIKLELA